jgi:hypothetical protein
MARLDTHPLETYGVDALLLASLDVPVGGAGEGDEEDQRRGEEGAANFFGMWDAASGKPRRLPPANVDSVETGDVSDGVGAYAE